MAIEAHSHIKDKTRYSPVGAAILNLVPLGFGYLYLGRPKRFLITALVAAILGVLTLAVVVMVAFSACFVEDGRGRGCSGAEVIALWLVVPLVLLLLALFTVRDALRLAHEINETRSDQSPIRREESSET